MGLERDLLGTIRKQPRRRYGPRGPRALRNGSLEIIITPANGSLSSKIKKMAHDAERANRHRKAKVVAFISENRLKLAKIMISQNIRIAIKGSGIELSFSANSNRRV